MTREDAQQRYPAAEPVLSSVAIRNLPETHGQQHSAGGPRRHDPRRLLETMKYNKDHEISSFEDAILKLRPHTTMRILTTIGLMAWNKKGTRGINPPLAALEWSQSMDKAK